MLRLTACGLTYKEIGHHLGVSRKNVANRLWEARDVLGVANNCEAVWLMRHALAEMPDPTIEGREDL